MAEFKLVSVDLDYTLLSSNHSLDEAQIPYLEAISEKAILVFASGRPLSAMEPVVKLLRPGTVSYLISDNGALLTNEKGDQIREAFLPSETVLELLERARQAGVHAHFYLDGKIVTNYMSPFIERDARVTGLEVKVVADLEDIVRSNRLHKLIVMGDPQKVRPFVNSILPIPEINPIVAKPYFVEIPPAGVDKGTTLKELTEMLSIRPEEILSAGDSFNDVGMLRFAGLGLAMKNAQEGVQKEAERVLTITNDENLAEVLDGILQSATREQTLAQFTRSFDAIDQLER